MSQGSRTPGHVTLAGDMPSMGGREVRWRAQGVVCWRSFIECIAGVQERRREFSLMTHNDRDSVPFSKILH